MHEFMKTIISTIKTWTSHQIDKKLADVIAITEAQAKKLADVKAIAETQTKKLADVKAIAETQADWDQNDSSVNDYIKNRTHYEERNEWLALSNTYTFSSPGSRVSHYRWWGGNSNRYYIVIWDGVVYEYNTEERYYYLGNASIVNDDEVDTGEPFYITSAGTDINGYIYSRESGKHTIEIYNVGVTIHQLDKKYIPNPISFEVIASEWLRDEYNCHSIDGAFEEINRKVEDVNKKIGQDYIRIKDIANGYNYIIQMQNGNLITFPEIDYIRITTKPNKITYMQGELFDPTGMVVTAYYQDGTTMIITDYSYPKYVMSDTIEITYDRYDSNFYQSLTVDMTQLDDNALIDFNYTKNADGTYTITGWKETYNGNSDNNMVVPNSCMIKL